MERREVLDGVSRLVRSTRGHPHAVLISVGGQRVRFLSDHPDGIHVARTILGPYCDITDGGITDGGSTDGGSTDGAAPTGILGRPWTVTSARVDGLAAWMARLVEQCAAAGVSPLPVRRWPGDFPSDRYDLADGYAVVVHRRPFVGLAVFSRDDRELHYLRPDSAFDASNTEHVLKYPLRTMLRQAGLSQVHAAGCVSRGRGILIMGRKGSGKSTLLAQFMSRGCRQVSNDLSFVRVAPGGGLEMIAFPHITRMAPGTVMGNDMLREGLAREERTGDYLRSPVFNGGKEEFYFPVLERIWGRDPVCRLAPLDVVIFPEFDLECDSTVSGPLPRNERDERIRRSVVDDPPLPDWLPFMPDAEFRARAAAAAETLLQSDPPAYELHFGPGTSDPVDEIERILERPPAPVWKKRPSTERAAREIGANRMETNGTQAIGTDGVPQHGTFRVKRGLADMLKGGVIMDVVTPDQAKIAEEAGAVAVMALERVPADIRRDGGVARMSDPEMIEGIKAAVTIPVMAKCRIGHFAEAQVLQALEVDFIDESEVLTPADEAHHVDKWKFRIPFVCGATNLGEALRRISEGAAMIRSKGEAGTGNIVEAVRHLRSITSSIRAITQADSAELYDWAKQLRSPVDLVREIAENATLPVPLFCAGGIATPADASLVLQLGAQAVFVGSGIFKSENPEARARAIVEAATHYASADAVARVSRGLGEAMPGAEIDKLDVKLAERGW